MSTKIEWTDETWNPVTGCTKVSQGCKHCYAERLWPKVEGARVKRGGGAVRPFTDVRVHADRLNAPQHWRTPRRVFVNSMSDLFHEDVPFSFIAQVWCRMANAPEHTFQILTKRPQQMLEFFSHVDMGCGLMTVKGWDSDIFVGAVDDWPLRNVWLGVSAEDQATFDERVEQLGQTPAAVRFVSCEPLLGHIDTGNAFDDPPEGSPYGKIHWVIAGGESGPKARPSHPDWFRSLRDQCQAAGVPFFFKQWGEWAPETVVATENGARDALYIEVAGSTRSAALGTRGQAVTVQRNGKRAAGRLLDGREWNEYPR